MITTYVIRSLSKKFRYIGITNDIERRLKEHSQGKNKSTKGYVPYEIVLLEDFSNYAEARKREIFLKSGQGRKFLDSL